MTPTTRQWKWLPQSTRLCRAIHMEVLHASPQLHASHPGMAHESHRGMAHASHPGMAHSSIQGCFMVEQCEAERMHPIQGWLMHPIERCLP